MQELQGLNMPNLSVHEVGQDIVARDSRFACANQAI
jgi:hypothetical protein